jgi:hypothetical protein
MNPLLKGSIAVIPNNTALSQELDLGEHSLVGLIMPAGWTAASITFAVAPGPNQAFLPLYDDGGTEVTITVAASRHVTLSDANIAKLRAARFLKIRSGTSGAPVNQGAERQIQTLVTNQP